MPGYAYDPWTGEFLCPCPGSDTMYYSRQTGQLYCIICPDGPAPTQAFNSYDLQAYCICPST